jgi:hypothetical protein
LDLFKAKRMADEKIGGFDCYVLVEVMKPIKLPKTKVTDAVESGTTTITFWIGKKDHLIHQCRSVTTAHPIPVINFTDEAIQFQLTQRNKPVTPENMTAMRLELDKMTKLTEQNGMVVTETHENVVLNKKFLPADFIP